LVSLTRHATPCTQQCLLLLSQSLLHTQPFTRSHSVPFKKKMAVMAVHQFAQCITCHAWSPDQSSDYSLSLVFFRLESEKILLFPERIEQAFHFFLFSFTSFRKSDSTVVSILYFFLFIDGLWRFFAFVDAILIGSLILGILLMLVCLIV